MRPSATFNSIVDSLSNWAELSDMIHGLENKRWSFSGGNVIGVFQGAWSNWPSPFLMCDIRILFRALFSQGLP
jgi:hypothetical protein